MGFNTQEQDQNFNFNYLVVQTTMKLRDAKANKDWWGYWVHFEFVLQLLLSYIEPAVALEIQKDFDDMDGKILKLEKAARDGFVAEKTRDIQIDLLRADFCNRHRYYVLKALNKVGIVKVADDGIIDFDSTSLKILSDVMGSHVEEREEKLKKGDTADIKFLKDFTLVVGTDPVTGDPRVFRMTKDDYKEYVNAKIKQKINETKNEKPMASTELIQEVEKQISYAEGDLTKLPPIYSPGKDVELTHVDFTEEILKQEHIPTPPVQSVPVQQPEPESQPEPQPEQPSETNDVETPEDSKWDENADAHPEMDVESENEDDKVLGFKTEVFDIPPEQKEKFKPKIGYQK